MVKYKGKMGVEQEEEEKKIVELPFLFLSPEESSSLKERGVRKLVERGDSFWCQPPYPHEICLVLAFFYLVEKKNREGLGKEEMKKAALFIDWLISLTEEQAEAEKPLGRQKRPLLLSQRNKEIMRHQLEFLSREDREKEEKEAFLVAFFRGHIQTLANAGLIRGGMERIRALEQRLALKK